MTAAMTQREIGPHWFDRHAMKGAAEIFEVSHWWDGKPRPRFIRGSRWDTRERMLEYYDPNGRRYYEYGVVEVVHFDSWEAAENWLRATTKGAGG